MSKKASNPAMKKYKRDVTDDSLAHFLKGVFRPPPEII